MWSMDYILSVISKKQEETRTKYHFATFLNTKLPAAACNECRVYKTIPIQSFTRWREISQGSQLATGIYCKTCTHSNSIKWIGESVHTCDWIKLEIDFSLICTLMRAPFRFHFTPLPLPLPPCSQVSDLADSTSGSAQLIAIWLLHLWCVDGMFQSQWLIKCRRISHKTNLREFE